MGAEAAKRLHDIRTRYSLYAWHPRLPDTTALDMMRKVAELGDVHGAPFVGPLLFDQSPEVRLAAAETLDLLVRRAAPLDYRELGFYCEYAVPKAHVERIPLYGQSAAVTGMASLHPNGYVREAAVRQLARRTDGEELPFLLLRANDRVPQVREAAEAALDSRLRPDYAAHYARFFPLVLWLLTCWRTAHAGFVDRVKALLRSLEARGALLDGLDARDAATRRALFALAFEAAAPAERGKVAERALNDLDPRVRTQAARWLRATGDAQLLGPLLSRMLADPLSAVRVEALCAVARRPAERTVPALMAAMLDRSSAVRETSRWLFAAAGRPDFPGLYRRAVETEKGDRLKAAIAGLGETGTPADAELLAPFVRHSRTRVAREAVRAVARLDGDGYAAVLQEALLSDSAKVSAAARETLLPRVHLAGRDWLWQVFDEDGRCHVRRNALALVAATGKWQSIPLLVRACADPEPKLAAFAADQVAVWLAHYNRGFAVPTPAQLAELSDALQSAGGGLPPEARADLATILAGWRQGPRG